MMPAPLWFLVLLWLCFGFVVGAWETWHKGEPVYGVWGLIRVFVFWPALLWLFAWTAAGELLATRSPWGFIARARAMDDRLQESGRVLDCPDPPPESITTPEALSEKHALELMDYIHAYTEAAIDAHEKKEHPPAVDIA